MDSTRGGRPILTLAELLDFDPQAPANRCWCPLCGEGKPRDAAHRSLSFDRVSGKWKCFRCNAGGTLREFWREKTGDAKPGADWKAGAPRARSTLRAAFALSPTTPPPQVLPAQNVSPSESTPSAGASTGSTPAQWRERWEIAVSLPDTPGAEYLARRGIALEVAQLAGVRFCADWNATPAQETKPEAKGKKRRAMAAVVFPIRAQHGEIVAAQARAISGSAKLTAGPKKEGAFFAPVQMKSGRIFAPLDAHTPVIAITEAPIDALSLACAGFPALALCGTSGPSWLHIACGLRRVALALDADEAGDRAATELEKLLVPFGARCTRLIPQDAKDWNEMLLQIGAARLDEFLTPRLLAS